MQILLCNILYIILCNIILCNILYNVADRQPFEALFAHHKGQSCVSSYIWCQGSCPLYASYHQWL